jgi:hypothetical protein
MQKIDAVLEEIPKLPLLITPSEISRFVICRFAVLLLKASGRVMVPVANFQVVAAFAPGAIAATPPAIRTELSRPATKRRTTSPSLWIPRKAYAM